MKNPRKKQLPGWFVTQLVFHLWRYGRHGQGTRNFSKPGSMANSNMLWCRQNIEWNHLAPLGYWSKGYSWSNKWWFKNIGNGTEMETNGNRKSDMFICSSIWWNSAAPWLPVGLGIVEKTRDPNRSKGPRALGLSLHTSSSPGPQFQQSQNDHVHFWETCGNFGVLPWFRGVYTVYQVMRRYLGQFSVWMPAHCPSWRQ